MFRVLEIVVPRLVRKMGCFEDALFPFVTRSQAIVDLLSDFSPQEKGPGRPRDTGVIALDGRQEGSKLE